MSIGEKSNRRTRRGGPPEAGARKSLTGPIAGPGRISGAARLRRAPLHLILVVLLSCALCSVTRVEGQVRLAADRIFEDPYFEWIDGKRVGLITNATGVNHRLESTMDLLGGHPRVRLTVLFGPEHGISGVAQAGQKMTHLHNTYSLYGETRAPTAEMLKDVDVLVYDIQDVGVRFYTYISTLYLSMKAAARQEIPFVVLDRPNAIDGSRVEGPVLEPGLESFVGIYALPIRYGMTSGELAHLLNQEASLGCDLKVVPLEGWQRRQWYDQTDLEWILPSPNMPTLMTATVYPGFCLIEGTNLSEGRGTTRPFELIGAPWLDTRELAHRLNALELPGVHFRPQAFTPTFSKYQGEICRGLQVHILDRQLFEPITTALHALHEILKLHPDQFKFNDEAFDRLAGNGWIRKMLREGTTVNEIGGRWQTRLREFQKTRERYLLYR